ncbi:MAG TPA: GNAT family N-acetyltransferase [Ferrovibrio sp.]|jgi:ribosomal protein S18 acetylase RimI-like enzyme|uniref:GNAT family N-acetyltransferase n=1 Tax=Ferrovibrio sp. TaxID=1917215 RepID=UPI002B4ADB40|nr:GNAT family N-acetyltransferase [Ferrovibrio sp.]HLT78983.1 GNAT family N-acetyltransferase [Ferrovibrio sp.]
MSAQTIIRKAEPGDLDALVALENRCFDGDRMSRRSYAAALRNPRASLLVAMAGMRLVGSAVVLRRSDSPAARLYSVAVDPTLRGRGLGARLLAEAEQAARNSGAASLRLEVKDRNRTALALYGKSGYGIIGRIAQYYADGSDALRLEKPL